MRLIFKKSKADNRRRERRYALPTLTAYTEEGLDYKEKLINVSRNGCCIQTPVPLKKGEHVLIHFISSNNYYVIEDSYCIDGCIVWKVQNKKQDSYRYGVEFPEVRTEFLSAENRAFKNHVAGLALKTYLDKNKQNG